MSTPALVHTLLYDEIWYRLYSMGMTEEIREKVKQIMRERGISQEQAAEALKVEQPSISRMLRHGGVGKIPESWAALLKYLGLKVTVVEDEE